MDNKKRPEQNRSARDGNIHNVPRGTTQVAACDNHPTAPLILNADNSDTPGLFALAYRLGSVLSARGVSSHGSQPAAMPLCLKTRDTRLFHRRFNYGVHYNPVKCSCQDLFCNLFSFFAKISAFMKVNRILRHIYIEFDIFPFFGLYLLKRIESTQRRGRLRRLFCPSPLQADSLCANPAVHFQLQKNGGLTHGLFSADCGQAPRNLCFHEC